MKKIYALFVALTAVVSLSAKTVYLHVNDDWKSFGAVFFVHAWGGTADVDAKLVAVDGNDYLFSAEIADNNNLLFVRAQGECESIPWDTENLWTQTYDMEIPADKDCFWLLGWTEGVWMVNGERPAVALVGDYAEDMWGANATNTMTPANDNATASVTLTLAAGTYEIKVWVEGFYMSLNGEGETLFNIHRDYNHADNVNLINDGRNFQLTADMDGNYTFKWNYASRNLEVTFPVASGIENANANTKAVKRIVNGQLVIEKNGVQYNALGAEMR